MQAKPSQAKLIIFFPFLLQGVPSSALREICLLKELKHKNIVRYACSVCLLPYCNRITSPGLILLMIKKKSVFHRLHDVLHSDKKLTLVFEYCDQVRWNPCKLAVDFMHAGFR